MVHVRMTLGHYITPGGKRKIGESLVDKIVVGEARATTFQRLKAIA